MCCRTDYDVLDHNIVSLDFQVKCVYDYSGKSDFFKSQDQITKDYLNMISS